MSRATSRDPRGGWRSRRIADVTKSSRFFVNCFSLGKKIALTRPTRAAAARTNDAIISTNAELKNTTKLGRRLCEVTNLYL